MKPLTRKEQFFNYICGKSASKPKPMTREEKILDEFEPVMTVNVTANSDNIANADKTFDEIKNALDNGTSVTVNLKHNSNIFILNVCSYNDAVLLFSGIAANVHNGEWNLNRIYGLTIDNSNNAYWKYAAFSVE